MGPGFHTGGFTVAFGHGHPLVIVVVQVGAVKMCVASVEALRKKE